MNKAILISTKGHDNRAMADLLCKQYGFKRSEITPKKKLVKKK